MKKLTHPPCRRTPAVLTEYHVDRGDADLALRAGDVALVDHASGEVTITRTSRYDRRHLGHLLLVGTFGVPTRTRPTLVRVAA